MDKPWIFIATRSPEWWAAIFLLISLMIQGKLQFKRLKIWLVKGLRKDALEKESYSIMVSNSGSLPIGIKSYGYKTWTGIIHEEKWFNIINDRLEPESPELELTFYDSIKGENIQIPEENIYYYFVNSSGGYIKRKYTIFRLFAWVKRFYIYISSLY